MERTSKLERILFRAVRMLMLIATLLALLAALGLGIHGLIKANASADDRIKAPTVSLDAYTNQLAQEKTAQEKAARDVAKTGEVKTTLPKKPTAPVEPEQFPAQYRDILNDIEKSIATYAQKTGQPSPTEALRRNLFLEADSAFKRFGLVDDFFGKLAQLSKSLDASGDELAKLDDNDPRKIFWGRFLDYVYDRYQADLTRQVNAINRAQREAEMTRMMAKAEYTKAGICAGAFLVLTLLLVLLNIEQNTYVASAVLRSVHPDADAGRGALTGKRPSSEAQSGNTGGDAA